MKNPAKWIWKRICVGSDPKSGFGAIIWFIWISSDQRNLRLTPNRIRGTRKFKKLSEKYKTAQIAVIKLILSYVKDSQKEVQQESEK